MLKTEKTAKNLGKKCINHLRNESDFLQQCLHSWLQVGDLSPDSGPEFEEKKQTFLSKAHEIQSARLQLKKEIVEFQPDREPTIAELAKHLDSDLQSELEVAHRRVMELTQTVEAKQTSLMSPQ